MAFTTAWTSSHDASPSSSGGDLPGEKDLRDLVLEWVDEEREARRRAQKLLGEDKRRQELEYGARHQAFMLAQEHGLPQWQENEFAELFLEMALRAEEIDKSIDLATADPKEVERLYAEYDAWVDRRERELTARLDPELYEKIYGDG